MVAGFGISQLVSQLQCQQWPPEMVTAGAESKADGLKGKSLDLKSPSQNCHRTQPRAKALAVKRLFPTSQKPRSRVTRGCKERKQRWNTAPPLPASPTLTTRAGTPASSAVWRRFSRPPLQSPLRQPHAPISITQFTPRGLREGWWPVCGTALQG